MEEKTLHSFEAGRRGKPDELESCLASLAGAYFLDQSNKARFDIRVNGDYLPSTGIHRVRLSGEVSDFLLRDPGLSRDLTRIITEHLTQVNKQDHAHEAYAVELDFKPQAVNLALNGFAGDSGNPIAVAYARTPNHLPWERYLAVGIRDVIDTIFQNDGQVPAMIAEYTGIDRIPGLWADGKVEVDALYRGAELDLLKKITVAAEHVPSVPVEALRESLGRIIKGYLEMEGEKYNAPLGTPKLYINPLGAWNSGGWKADAGSREAKPYRDGFATYGVNEDSFSGEDPSKPSATGTFLARKIAVMLVEAGLADFARVSLSYTIGLEEPELNVTTNGTGKASQDEIHEWVRARAPLTIPATIQMLNLRDAELYRRFARNSDYFHDPSYAWNHGL